VSHSPISIDLQRKYPMKVSTDAKLNLYLFLGKLSIGAECGGISARKYKNDCAQVLSGCLPDQQRNDACPYHRC
jgi:hypothetical protein